MPDVPYLARAIPAILSGFVVLAGRMRDAGVAV